jgi:hypothetical protein
MKKWVKMLTMIIVGAVFLIGVTSAHAIMTNGTEIMYDALSGELTFEADPNSQYDLSPFNASVKADEIFIDVGLYGTLYEFLIPNFYDPLPKKTVDITMVGANSDASGLDLARVLNVFGTDSPFGVDGPAVPVMGYFVAGTTSPMLVAEHWEIFPNPDFEYVKIWVPDAFNLVSIKIVTQSVPGPNQPPEANCQDVTVSTEAGLCSADASVDDGSVDPDGDPITLVQEPPEPYELGDTVVTLTVTDDSGENDSCTATVTVIDDIAPVAECNAAPTIVPPDAPISFIATAEDNCVVSSVVITEYDCSFINGAGKLVDKKESCVVEFSGDTITIQDSGGVGDHITWTILATDDSGNTTEVECAVDVVNPGKGK